MIEKEFINYLVEKSGIKKTDLIEKDFVLHRLIQELMKNELFKENFIFKGGTCLIKCYFGYYRFSEDLDFTWRKQELWINKSGKQIRKIISTEIGKILNIINEICIKLGLDFKPDKKDKKYIEFGAGNIYTTFKFWYKSCISNDDKFVKLQINFVDKIFYKFRKHTLKNIIGDIYQKEIEFLFPSYKEILYKKSIMVYDVREILLEKIRAIITRRGIKVRDFIDAYFIINSRKENLEDYEKIVIEKILFALKYEKYLKNLVEKHKRFVPFKLKDEYLLLKPIRKKDFDKFMINLYGFLNEILEKIKVKIEEN